MKSAETAVRVDRVRICYPDFAAICCELLDDRFYHIVSLKDALAENALSKSTHF